MSRSRKLEQAVTTRDPQKSRVWHWTAHRTCDGRLAPGHLGLGDRLIPADIRVTVETGSKI